MNGRFDFIILHLLSRKEMYGSQIIKCIADITDGEVEMKTGTLYPLLQTLEDNGYVSAKCMLVHGRNRKVYRITESGRKYLLQQKDRWYKWESFINKILDL